MKVVIENSEIIQLMKDDDSEFFSDVAKEVGKENLIFEAGPAGWPSVAAWMIQNIGPDVNIENISEQQIIILDAMRRGLNRNIEYSFFTTT